MPSIGEQGEASMEIKDGEIPGQEVVVDNDFQEIPSTQDFINEIPGLEWIGNGLELNLGTIGVTEPLPEPVYTPSELIHPYPYSELPSHNHSDRTIGDYLSSFSNLSVEESSYVNSYPSVYYPANPTVPSTALAIDPYLEATIFNHTNISLQQQDHMSRKEYLELVESYYRMKTQRDQALNMVEELRKLIRRLGYQMKQVIEESKYPLLL